MSILFVERFSIDESFVLAARVTFPRAFLLTGG
jgi:hypothetical protein